MSARLPVTLSTENGPSRFRPPLDSRLATSVGQRPAYTPRRPIPPPTGPWLLMLGERKP
jgi:hypothetical protein